MLNSVVDLLRCPHCRSPLTRQDRALVCPRGHSFDIARQGYVSLLASPTKFAADTAPMVRARDAFLGAGHYDAIVDGLVRFATRWAAPSGCVVDVGGGTGFYSARVLDALPGRTGIVLDISKFAARHAASAHASMGAVVADAWQPLPIETGTAGLVLDVFAPRNGPELHRILAPEGALLVVVPRKDHLGELVEGLGLIGVDDDKADRLDRQLAERFTRVDAEDITTTMTLPHESVRTLVAMGPNAWHSDDSAISERLEAFGDPMTVTMSVSLIAYRALPR
ncbi:putative RNA methyltransferase [Saccharothrix xinjiangensis]|uniref:RNA methyltransferase n=1 Tax=Saccharothrix xinjiangensis TaxID=204798 RepID=A0ABV9Y7R6_9PSEU